MSYERRRNALVRLGAPPCQRCGRISPDREITAAPKRFLPNGSVFGQEDDSGDPIVVAYCCTRCRNQIQRNRQSEVDERRRQMEYEQQQHEIRMHQHRMERARANPEYVRACMQMQHELKDILGHY